LNTVLTDLTAATPTLPDLAKIDSDINAAVKRLIYFKKCLHFLRFV
jgi:hypothetical protein